ncbi:mechanosensitive ion channel family protein [Chryseobacterium sp. A301]
MEESKAYIELVYHVLEDWRIRFAEFTPNLIVGIVVFSTFAFGSKYFAKITVKVVHKLFPRTRDKDTIVSLVGVFRFFILLIATFITLEIMGLNGFFMKLLGSLGVAGIIAGVALKDIVSSMFSGMLVNIDKAFKIGDYVTINGISGTVVEIGFLTTKLIADDGRKVYIPNQLIFSAPFVNYSASEYRVLSIGLEIPNTQDLQKAKQSLLDETKKFTFVDTNKNIDVFVMDQRLGIYSIEVRFTMKKGESILNVKSESILQLKKRLDQEGIETSIPALPYIS